MTQLSRHKKLSPFAEHLSAVSNMNVFLAALSCNPDFGPAIEAASKGDREGRDAAVEKGIQKTALANELAEGFSEENADFQRDWKRVIVGTSQ